MSLNVTLRHCACLIRLSGVNVQTGDVFPASFSYKGPAEELRAARTFTGGQVILSTTKFNKVQNSV